MPEPRGMYGSMGCEHCSRRGQLLSQHFFSWSRVKKSCHGCAQAPPGDSAIRLQLAEREQALLLAQETIQVSPHSISPAKCCPRGGTEAGTASLCLPNCPATVVYMTAQTGICSVPSTSWAAPVSVPRLWWHPQAWASLALALPWSSWPTVWLRHSSGCSRAGLGFQKVWSNQARKAAMPQPGLEMWFCPCSRLLQQVLFWHL